MSISEIPKPPSYITVRYSEPLNLILDKEEVMVHWKWVRDNFRAFGKWWERYRLVIKTEDITEEEKDREQSDWKPAIEEYEHRRTRPVVHVPVAPRRLPR